MIIFQTLLLFLLFINNILSLSLKQIYLSTSLSLFLSNPLIQPVFAADKSIDNSNICNSVDVSKPKKSIEEIKKIISSDLTDRQALITADFTRDIYSECCVFQDEIDKYPIDKYIVGTKALFDSKLSHVDLIGDVESSKPDSLQFKFKEKLTFNLPFKPFVNLSGKVIFTRDINTGLISYSREYWDQSVVNVLKSVKFN